MTKAGKYVWVKLDHIVIVAAVRQWHCL